MRQILLLLVLALLQFAEAHAQSSVEQHLLSNGCESHPNQNSIELLALRAPVTKEIHSSDTHWYRLDLIAGHFARVSVFQLSADVVITLCNRSGQSITQSQITRTSAETVPASLLADLSSSYATSPGTYFVRIEPASKDEDGKYEISISEDAEARVVDLLRIQAERSFMDGNFRREGGNEDKRLAIDAYLKSVTAYDELTANTEKSLMIEGTRGKALSKVFLAYCYGLLSEYQKALTYAHDVPELWRSLSRLQVEQPNLTSNLEAQAYSNIGYLEGEVGRLEEALEDDQKALDLWNDKVEKAGTFINMGMTSIAAGQFDRARDGFHHALDLLNDVPSNDSTRRLYEILALKDIGLAEFYSKRYDAAAEFFAKASALPDLPPRQKAGLLNNISALLIQAGSPQDLAKAEKTINEAADLWKSVGFEVGAAIAENSLGGLYRAKHDVASSNVHYHSALRILDELESKYGDVPDLVLKQVVLFNLARAEYETRTYVSARQHLEDAISLFEHTSTTFSDDDYRQAYFGSRPQLYELYIAVLMKLARLHPGSGYEALALQASEQARSRKLVSVLSKAQINVVPDISQSLFDRIRESQRRAKSALARWKQSVQDHVSEEQQSAAKIALRQSRASYDELLRELSEQDGRYADVFRPKVLSLPEMQELVADEKTIVLEYSLTEWGAYVWGLTKSHLVGVELQDSSKIIDGVVQDLRNDLTTRNCRIKLESPDEYLARINSSDTHFLADTRKLSKSLLKPVAAQLRHPHVVVVPDGSLQQIPFAALLDPESTGKSRFLGERHALTYLPSMRALKMARRGNGAKIQGSDSVAIFADLRTPNNGVDRTHTTLFRGFPSVIAGSDHSDSDEGDRGYTCQAGQDRLLLLPGARLEAKAIEGIARRSGRRATMVSASINEVLKPEFEDYQILHFATHAFAQGLEPGDSGIVLEDTSAAVPTLHYLGLADIYNMRLHSSLVTLSACETGIGKDIRGEGVVSLGRAFMYAGAPRVVTSLWRVDDKATAALMSSFYGGMFSRHLSPPEALASAQREMKRHLGWHSPYYWASFIIEGDWLNLPQ
jgi:CHAT domain-containing protein